LSDDAGDGEGDGSVEGGATVRPTLGVARVESVGLVRDALCPCRPFPPRVPRGRRCCEDAGFPLSTKLAFWRMRMRFWSSGSRVSFAARRLFTRPEIWLRRRPLTTSARSWLEDDVGEDAGGFSGGSVAGSEITGSASAPPVRAGMRAVKAPAAAVRALAVKCLRRRRSMFES